MQHKVIPVYLISEQTYAAMQSLSPTGTGKANVTCDVVVTAACFEGHCIHNIIHDVGLAGCNLLRQLMLSSGMLTLYTNGTDTFQAQPLCTTTVLPHGTIQGWMCFNRCNTLTPLVTGMCNLQQCNHESESGNSNTTSNDDGNKNKFHTNGDKYSSACIMLQDTAGFSQPASKRQKTQAFRVQLVTYDPLKSHKAADGHVYFDVSSDSDAEPHRQQPNSGDAAGLSVGPHLQSGDADVGTVQGSAAPLQAEAMKV